MRSQRRRKIRIKPLVRGLEAQHDGLLRHDPDVEGQLKDRCLLGQIQYTILNLSKIGLFSSMIPRQLTDHIREVAQQMPVLSITGPRQSGKTTLCRALFLYPAPLLPQFQQAPDQNPQALFLRHRVGMLPARHPR